MKDGIGKDRTREDHANVASQLYAAYAQYNSVKSLVTIIGEEGLGSKEIKIICDLERASSGSLLIKAKTKTEQLNKLFPLLGIHFQLLPDEELTRIHPEFIKKYFPKIVKELK